MFVAVLLLLIAGCDTSDDTTQPPRPVVRITSCDITERSISVLITVLDAESAAWQCREWDGIPPIASNILSFGTPISEGEDMLVEIDGLLPEREYVVAVAAVAADRETTTHIRLSTLAENKEDDDDGKEDDGKEDDGGSDDGKEDDDTGNEPIELLGVLFDGAQLITTSDVATTVIELTSSDAQCSLLIDFKRMPTATLLADTYSCAEGDVALLFSGAATSEDIVAAEGEVIVERDHDIYTLTIAFRGEELTLTGEYEGEIAGLNVEQPDDGGAEDDDDKEVGEDKDNDNDNEEDAPLLVSATATKIGRYWALTLASADKRTSLYVEVYGYNIDYDYLVPGTYRVKSYGYEFEEGDIDYYYSSLQMNGEKVQLASGTLDIKLDGEQYVIGVDITDAQSRTLETTYCGVIEVMPL